MKEKMVSGKREEEGGKMREVGVGREEV